MTNLNQERCVACRNQRNHIYRIERWSHLAARQVYDLIAIAQQTKARRVIRR